MVCTCNYSYIKDGNHVFYNTMGVIVSVKPRGHTKQHLELCVLMLQIEKSSRDLVIFIVLD